MDECDDVANEDMLSENDSNDDNTDVDMNENTDDINIEQGQQDTEENGLLKNFL